MHYREYEKVRNDIDYYLVKKIMIHKVKNINLLNAST